MIEAGSALHGWIIVVAISSPLLGAAAGYLREQGRGGVLVSLVHYVAGAICGGMLAVVLVVMMAIALGMIARG